MDLWEKIKEGLQEGASVVSEKATDLVDAGTDFVQERVHKVANDPIEALEVSKLRAEVRLLRETIRDQFTALGGQVYVLHTTKKREALELAMKTDVSKLEKLRDELEAKEKNLNELKSKYEGQSISMSALKKFRDELSEAGGSLEHLVVDHTSPSIGKALSEIECPDDLLIGMIIRKGETIIPGGEDVIEVNDKIVLLGKKDSVVEMMQQFQAEQSQTVES